MEKVDVSVDKTPSDSEDRWIEEIIRETDHFYQGEMRQEDRGSWLLATSSALMAIYLSTFVGAIQSNLNIPKALLLLPVISFFISAVLAILGFMPYSGTKGVRLLGFGIRKKIEKSSVQEFVHRQFHIDESFSGEGYKNRVFFHYRSHYIRNYQKSRIIIWSTVFILLGLLSSFVVIFVI